MPGERFGSWMPAARRKAPRSALVVSLPQHHPEPRSDFKGMALATLETDGRSGFGPLLTVGSPTGLPLARMQCLVSTTAKRVRLGEH